MEFNRKQKLGLTAAIAATIGVTGFALAGGDSDARSMPSRIDLQDVTPAVATFEAPPAGFEVVDAPVVRIDSDSDSVQSFASVQSIDSPESVDSFDSVDSVQSFDSVDSVQSFDSVDSVQSFDSVDSVQSFDSVDSVQSIDSVDSPDDSF